MPDNEGKQESRLLRKKRGKINWQWNYHQVFSSGSRPSKKSS